MPVYEYEHLEEGCEIGQAFELTQSIKDQALAACPQCGRAVHRLISRVFVSIPQSNSDLKNMGFTKLVKRDTGVYENVTQHDGESRYMVAGDNSTVPDLKSRISD